MLNKKIIALVTAVGITGAAAGGAGAYVFAGSTAELTAGPAVTSAPADTAAPADGEAALTKTSSVTAAATESDIFSVSTEGSEEEFSYSSVADVAEACMPSVVAITAESVQTVQSMWLGHRQYQYKAQSAGSGIIIGSNDEELLICTNEHVVSDASDLTVTFADGTSLPSFLKGSDPDNDLAITAVSLSDIPDETMDQIKIARIGDSDSMRVGEQVVAIGNALGYGQSVTTGIISAKDRSLLTDDTTDTNSYQHLIQTDAAINPGNSGGALMNMRGEVIGINSAKAAAASSEGMGYAIPVSLAMPILEDLMTQKTRIRLDADKAGYMGITGQGVSNEAVLFYGIPKGVYVTSVEDGSPASNAGLEEGDIITAFDGQAITGMQELQSLQLYYEPGEEVELTVCAGSEDYTADKTLTVTLGDRSQLQ